MTRYNPDRTLVVEITRGQLDALAHGRPVTIEPPAEGPVQYGVFGGRSWKGGDYMAGSGWEQKKVGEPHFEVRTVRCLYGDACAHR